MITYIILTTFILTCFYSCDQEKYIKIDDYIILDDNPDLFRGYSKKRIIRMKCSTNFPPETVIVIKKELGVQTTSETSIMKYEVIDTIVLKGDTFEFLFSPSFLGGVLSFNIYRSSQNAQVNEQLAALEDTNDLLYTTEYSTYYKILENTKPAVELLIETWD